MRVTDTFGSFLLLLQTIIVSADVQLYQFTTEETGLSMTCVTVLNQAVTCDEYEDLFMKSDLRY